MKKRILAVVLTFFFVIGIAGAGMAARVKCEVTGVDGETVTLNCGDKADKFKEGDELKISTPKKGAAVEGC